MSYISTKNQIEDFYFFENKIEAIEYCQRLADCLFTGSVSEKEQYVIEQMKELSNNIRPSGGHKSKRNLLELEMFLKDCLLWLDKDVKDQI